MGELTKTCDSHKYQQLPLISVDEFLQQHPEHAADDENALMVARINQEYAQREALEQARQGLLKKKQGLIADNKKRRDDLANLDRDLEKFIDVRKPDVSVLIIPFFLFSGRTFTDLALYFLRRPNPFRNCSRRSIE